MKQLFTILIVKNEEKKIHVWVDDETAAMLENVSEELRHQYIADEYKVTLSNRRETRRHQSLEASTDNGFDIADDSQSPEEMAIRSEERQLMKGAISLLNPRQQFLVSEVLLNGRTKRDVAKELGVSEAAIGQQIVIIIDKLKNILKKFSI